MSTARPQFSIDDAFELSLEDAGPGPESSGVARFGPLHFERRARFEVADEDKQSRLRYQVNGPSHLTHSPCPGGTPGQTLENISGENLPRGPTQSGETAPGRGPDPKPYPNPRISDVGPQPSLGSPESELGSSSPPAPPPVAGDPTRSPHPSWVLTLRPLPRWAEELFCT